MEIIRLNAGNDRNGNPRRVFVCIEEGEIVATYDEGYKGLGALPKSIRSLPIGPRPDGMCPWQGW